MTYFLHPLGDSAIVIEFERQNDDQLFTTIQNLFKLLEQNPFEGYIEAVPAYSTLTIHFNPLAIHQNDPYTYIQAYLSKLDRSLLDSPIKNSENVYELPIVFGAEFGPDLESLANHHQLEINQVIELYVNTIYTVRFVGFTPGFPFLSGLPSRLSTPRKSSPRIHVEKGSIGIAGNQTGIYPTASPGGWQIIGRTPVLLFDVTKQSPALLQAGDQVRFFEIKKKDIAEWEGIKWESLLKKRGSIQQSKI